MYFISLPLLDIYGHLNLKYNERLDMIKTSLLFKCGMRNTILSYLLLCLEIISFTAYSLICYARSTNSLPDYPFLMYQINILLLVVYITFSVLIYLKFDEEDYRTTIRINEILEIDRV